jgi:hypothetical protein
LSIEAIAVVLNHSKAKGAAKIVLLGIANHLGPDADEGAWPAQARLATYANITERGIRKAIDNLIELGEVTVIEHDGKSSGRNKPNRYLINLCCPETCDGTPSHRERLTTGTSEPDDRNFLPTTGTFLPDDRNSSSSEPLREPLSRTVRKNPALISSDFKPKTLDADRVTYKQTDIDLALSDFISYWTEQRKKKADWDATWRNNIGKVAEWPRYQKKQNSIWDTIEETK